MKTIGCLLLLIACSRPDDAPVQAARSGARKLIHDFAVDRRSPRERAATPAEQMLAERALGRPQTECSRIYVESAVDGSFTRPGARQTAVSAMETLTCVSRMEANTGAKAVIVLEAGSVVANAATSTWLVKDVVDVEGDGREELLLAFSPGTFQGAEVEEGAVLSFNGALSKETPLGNVVNDSCSSIAPTTRDYAIVVAVPSGSGMRLETSRRSVACPPPSP